MSTTTLPLQDAAWELGPELVANRRYLHQHPELAFQEENTARFVAEKLRELGIETQTGVARTGVVGLLHGRREDGQGNDARHRNQVRNPVRRNARR